MPKPWWVAGLLLGAACASGGAAGRAPATGGTPAPRPTMDPVRIEPIPGTRPGAVLQYPRSGGGITRYALSRRDSVTATMPSGETQLQILGRTAWVTLTWVATDSSTRITAVVDSIHADSGLLISIGLLDSARGARWSGTRDPQGRLRLDPGSSPSLSAAQVQDELLLLFPPLPPTGATPGSRWTDSVSGPGRVSAFTAQESVQIAATADAALTQSGTLPITLVRARSAAGEAVQFGQPISVRATGTDTLSYQLATDGRMVRMEGRRRTDLVVSLPSIGQSVPAQESSTLLFTLLR